jgi:hypothetical protein
MKIFLLILLILNLFNSSYSQESKTIYEQGLKISLEKLIHDNLEDKYYFTKYHTTYSEKGKLSDLFVMCNIEVESFKQLPNEKESISIPKEYRKYFRSNNLFNRLWYRKKLREIEISNLYYDGAKKLLTLRVRNNEDEMFMFFMFDIENKKIYECEEHYIF